MGNISLYLLIAGFELLNCINLIYVKYVLKILILRKI